MTSFRLSVSPHRRAAARFVSKVHRRLQKAYAEAPDVTQTAIANSLGVHRSVINRQLRGHKDMSLGRVAELAWAMGYEPEFDLVKEGTVNGRNTPTEKVNKTSLNLKAQTSSASSSVMTYMPDKRLPLGADK